MAWFSKTPPPPPPKTVLGPTAVLEGDLVTRSDVEVHGHIAGTLKTDSTLTVGRHGSLEGEARCSALEAAGRLKGHFASTGLASFGESARFEGDLSAKRLRVVQGAALSGRVRENRT